ncbi:MAG: glycosyltransferase family 2 protein [Chitinophagales bacterium]
MNLSIVIPLLNEEESLPELIAWIVKVCDNEGYIYEIVMVDDGSTDKSWQIIQELSMKHEQVKGIKFRRNYGKSAALNEAFAVVEGEVVITMDADLQDSPDEIPELYRLIKEENFHIVSGWKKERHDPLTKTIPTKLYNGVSRWVTGIKLHDMNCGLKSYQKAVVKNVEIYGEMHRYIPAMARWEGYTRIGEKVVQHRARKYGHTKFGLNRFINGFLDLMTIFFMSKFGKKPMHFFGLIGTVLFVIGFSITFYLAAMRLSFMHYGMTTRPLFYFGLLFIIVGSQLFLAGFIGELVARNSPYKNNYHVEDKVNL